MKIAQDVLHGMQYSFLAAAGQDKTFPPDSVEENFRLAIATRKPEKRAVYETKAREIAAQPVAARQALFGRYAALGIEEYGQLGYAAGINRLPPLQLDPGKLKAAVQQLLATPVAVPVSAAPGVGPGPDGGVHTLSGEMPSPTVKSVGFYITEVRCIDETNPEIGHDEISLGGMVIDDAGNTFKIDPFPVSGYFLEDAGQAEYDVDDPRPIDHDVTVVTFTKNGKPFSQFDTTKATPWPKNYAAIVFISELDDGGFASFLTDAWQKAAPTVKQWIEEAITKAGEVVFGEIGAIIGKALGKVIAWVVDKLVDWIIDAFLDDVSLPGTTLASLPTPLGASYFNSPGWSNFSTPEGQFDFQWADGEYTVKCHWHVEVPGYLLDNQKFQGHYVGVFHSGTDPHAFWVGDWKSFTTKWQELSNARLRLVDLETYLDGNTRFYAGVFRAGTDAYALWANAEWDNFKAKWEELSKGGLRLIDLQTYFDRGKRLYAGVFRAGTDAYSLWVGLDWPSFTAKWEAESKRGLRLVGISSYSEGGKRLFNGVFRAGTDAYALWASDWSGFTAKWKELSKGGLRLIDLDTYAENGKQMFVGVYRAGTDGYLLWNSDWNGFIDKWKEASQGGLRLIDLACY